MFEASKRRADTFNLVNEQRVIRDADTGTFDIIGGDIGWSLAAQVHLNEFFAAGLIADGAAPILKAGYCPQRLTVAGDYLFRRWLTGPAEAIVELPQHDPTLKWPRDMPFKRLDFARKVDALVVVAGGNDEFKGDEQVLLIGPPRARILPSPDSIDRPRLNVIQVMSPKSARELAAALLAAAR